MTLKIYISDKYASAVLYNKGTSRKLIVVELPYSFDELKLWYDLSQIKVRKIQFEDVKSHRKICQISNKKFEKLDFPELGRIRKLMMCEKEEKS